MEEEAEEEQGAANYQPLAHDDGKLQLDQLNNNMTCVHVYLHYKYNIM